jgi:hypothetical protein
VRKVAEAPGPAAVATSQLASGSAATKGEAAGKGEAAPAEAVVSIPAGGAATTPVATEH